MTRWEYKFLEGANEDKANALGREGWNLFGLWRDEIKNCVVAVFNRPLPTEVIGVPYSSLPLTPELLAELSKGGIVTMNPPVDLPITEGKE